MGAEFQLLKNRRTRKSQSRGSLSRMRAYRLPNSMLWEKVSAGDANGTKRALVGKADVNAVDTDNRGETALHKAAGRGFADVVRTLLQYRADTKCLDRMYKQTALHRASEQGHTDVVNLLVDNNSDPNVQDRYGESALHKAASGGHLDVITSLCDAGALVDLKSESGFAPLTAAAKNGHCDAVRLLIASGAAIDQRDITFGW